MAKVKFFSNASPIFKYETEQYNAKLGFNEMDEKFTYDPYYKLCLDGGLIKDFVSNPTDKQQEDFAASLQAERERADALEKELEALKAAQQPKEDKKPKGEK